MMQEEEVITTQLATVANVPAVLSVSERLKQNADMVKALAPQIKLHHLMNDQRTGNLYMKVAGGIAIAESLGYAISVSSVKFDQQSDLVPFYCATAKLIDRATGLEVASAEGYLGMDESRWAKADLYARRSMCQTRAVAKLNRVNFGAMYTLMGASSDTPAEEIPTDMPVAPSAPPVRRNDHGFALPAAVGGGEVMTVVECQEDKRGKSAKGDWVRYKATFAEGLVARTFSGSHAKVLSQALHDGLQVTVTWTPSQYGNDLKTVAIVEATK